MKIILLISGLIPVIILVSIGIAIKYKKAYWLISGYNTMSPEKKKNVDIEGLGKLAANVCFSFSFLIAVMFLLIYLDLAVYSLVVVVVFIPLIIYTLIKAQKYNLNSKNEKGKMKNQTKAAIGIISGLMILVAVGVGIMLHFSSIPAKFTIDNGIMRISGMYGQKISINEITDLEEKDFLPEIQTKTNGSALGSIYKGYFYLKGIGNAKLFIDSKVSPYIFIKYNSKTYILNCDNSLKTSELYSKLKVEWGKDTGK